MSGVEFQKELVEKMLAECDIEKIAKKGVTFSDFFRVEKDFPPYELTDEDVAGMISYINSNKKE